MIEIKKFETHIAGPKVLIFGAIHGNEVCGPLAINRLIAELESGNLILQKGALTLVPVCNPEAYQKNVRFTEDNLNRVFLKTEHPKSYEQKLANDLASLIDDADILFDIHSMQADGPTVTLFLDFPTPANRAWAQCLDIPYAILGWPDLYAGQGSHLLTGDTIQYAYDAGKTSLLLECGNHNDPEAPEVAYQAIKKTLVYFSLIAGQVTESKNMIEIHMTDLFSKENAGDYLVKPWKNFEPVSLGEVIAIRAGGQKIVAEKDCVMVLPKLQSAIGQEWFYLGEIRA